MLYALCLTPVSKGNSTGVTFTNILGTVFQLKILAAFRGAQYLAQLYKSTSTIAFVQKLQPKFKSKISAQMLVKHNDTFSDMCLMFLPLPFAPYNW